MRKGRRFFKGRKVAENKTKKPNKISGNKSFNSKLEVQRHKGGKPDNKMKLKFNLQQEKDKEIKISGIVEYIYTKTAFLSLLYLCHKVLQPKK